MPQPAHLPNRGPYAPENMSLPLLPNGARYSAFPHDQKYLDDPFWYDALGRTPVEQQRILLDEYTDEERVSLIRDVLKESEERSRESDREVPPSEDEVEERQARRLWSVALEVGWKGSGAVMRFLVREMGLRAAAAPRHVDGGFVEVRLAARHGYLDVVQVLVEEAGVEVNGGEESESPLVYAAAGGHLEVLRWLLGARAELPRSGEGKTALFADAAGSGVVEVVEYLLQVWREDASDQEWMGSEPGRVLGLAAQGGSEAMLTLVMERGGYGKAIENTEQQRRAASIAIPISIRNDETDWKCLEILIYCAIPRDNSGTFIKTDDETLLDNLSAAVANCSVRNKVPELKKFLSLITEATTVDWPSPRFQRLLDDSLHRCYDSQSRDAARELLENWHANPNTNDAGDTREPFPLPLQAAVSRGKRGWVKFWLDHGADVHRAYGPYCNGRTPLCLAVLLRNAKVAKLLLDYGGPVDKMEKGLVGKKEVNVVVYGNQKNCIELTTAAPMDQEEGDGESAPKPKLVVLNFEDGISEEWVQGIQYRRPDAELAQDGTGRPKKGRRM